MLLLQCILSYLIVNSYDWTTSIYFRFLFTTNMCGLYELIGDFYFTAFRLCFQTLYFILILTRFSVSDSYLVYGVL